MGEPGDEERLTFTCPRDRDAPVVCPRSCPGDRRVTHSPRQLAEAASGGRRRGEMTITVDGHGPDRAAAGDRHDTLAAEQGRISACEPCLLAEPVGARAGQQDRSLGRTSQRQDRPSGAYWALWPRRSTDCPDGPAGAVHDRRVGLDCSIAGRDGASPRVEMARGFEGCHGLDDGVEGGPTWVQHLPRSPERSEQVLLELSEIGRRRRTQELAGPTVNHDSGCAQRAGLQEGASSHLGTPRPGPRWARCRPPR